MARNRDQELDAALRSAAPTEDPELDGLVESARRLERSLQVPAPRASRERAFFVGAVAADRRRSLRSRFLMPAVAAAAILVLLGALGRGTLPGDTLYPVREAMASAGIVESPLEEADRSLARVESSLERADRLTDESPERARDLASEALGDLARARTIAVEANGEERLENIADLTEEASDILAESVEEARERRQDRDFDDGSSSGDGSGSGSDDSSGSGGSGSDG